jgi:peptide-methionine (S)-S-oxide reductase
VLRKALEMESMLRGLWLALVALLTWPADMRAQQQIETAIFAGGSFMSLEADLGRVVGVLSTEAGYAGGTVPSPGFEAVSAQTTGHHMAVRLRFDASRISYGNLLIAYWLSIDPTDGEGQFCERGDSFAPAIFALDAGQLAAAEATRARVEKLIGREVAVKVLPAGTFWRAEERHQQYAAKNPLRFDFYKRSCGQASGLAAFWGGVPMLADQW